VPVAQVGITFPRRRGRVRRLTRRDNPPNETKRNTDTVPEESRGGPISRQTRA
jgi:hypothetical protein